MSGLPRIIVITDRTQVQGLLDDVVKDLCTEAGCAWILVRERDLQPLERRTLALRLREITKRCGSHMSVSADPQLASEMNADGVHLQRIADVAEARRKLPDAWIGVSAHRIAEVEAAKEAGADYVTLSPIFPSESKPGYGPPLGLESIHRAAQFGIPVYALGGVTPRSAHACIEAGAHGIAVMGTVMRARDPSAIIREYAAAFATGSVRAG